MTSFITIMVLICQLNSAKQLVCFEKGPSDLRSTSVKSSKSLKYYKCSNNRFRDCDMDTIQDGCQFNMNDATVSYSSYTCS